MDLKEHYAGKTSETSKLSLPKDFIENIYIMWGWEKQMDKKKLFSIVIPVYGNEKNLPVTIPYIIEHLDLFPDYDVEIIMVCDGSPDNSWAVMKDLKRQYPSYIRNYLLNRRYTQKAAILCGFEQAKGDVLGTIAADLQEPFELFVDMLKKYEEGYELVVGYREDREDSIVNAWFAKAFHTMLHNMNSKYPRGGFDIFVLDRSLRNVFERSILNWGSMQYGIINMTDRLAYVGYTRQARKIGKSGFSLKRKIYIVLTTLVLNTDWVFLSMVFMGILASIGAVASIVAGAVFARSLSIVLFGILLFFLGILLSGIGMLGTSVYNWAQNLRGLPKYIIAEED